MRDSTPGQEKICPSAPAEPGAVLLGVVAAPGQLAYLTPHAPVTPALLERLARPNMPVENRLRFAAPCREQGCAQWRGEGEAGRCGLVDQVVEALGVVPGPAALPHCGLRQSCRWFAQQGRQACAACPEVIYRPG